MSAGPQHSRPKTPATVARVTPGATHTSDTNVAELAELSQNAPAALQLNRIVQMARSSAPIQRVLSDPQWGTLQQATSKTVHAKVTVTTPATGATTPAKLRYMPATDTKPARMQINTGTNWGTLGDDKIPTVKARTTWDGSFVNTTVHDRLGEYDAEAGQDHINNDTTAPVTNIAASDTGTLEMDIQSNKANDRLNFVHRSLSLYKRGGQNKQGREHLTLENEHMLAMLAQQRDKSSSGYDRSYAWGDEDRTATSKEYDKREVNDSLRDSFATREIDNLNFYLPTGGGGAEADMETAKPAGATLPAFDEATHHSPARPAAEDQLTLHNYLTFLARALKSTKDKSADEIVPAAYGVKYENLLANMEAQMGINPQQVFLDSSDVGHRKKFIQAVVVMQAKGLVKSLDGDGAWKGEYAKYHLNPPVLRQKGEGEDAAWVDVVSGSSPYNALDATYANAFYRPIRDAVLAYTGE